MRSHIEFRSQALLDADADDGGPHGENVAKLLAAHLPEYGYSITGIMRDDWGWRVELTNAAFPLWIGCGHYEEYSDGFLCFIEPMKPYVFRWLKRVPTRNVTSLLANAIEQLLCGNALVSNVRWWTDEEVNLGIA